MQELFDCCLMPMEKIFSYNVYHGENKLHVDEMMMMYALLVGFL